MSKKRKSSHIEHCFLHANGLQHGDFTPLSKIKGLACDKLEYLHKIRLWRLSEPDGSPHRMEEICSGIPESISSVDLETSGYHRGCYQNFTKNLDRLTSRRLKQIKPSHHSPRVISSASGVAQSSIIPPECIFCEKLDVKVMGKTERCITFPVFKDAKGCLKQPSWKQIEPRALELGNRRLYRMVQGEDLFARGAHFHQSCRKSFNLKYTNHIHDKKKAMTPAIFSDNMSGAHQTAFRSVLTYVNDNVIGNNEVVKLSSLRLLYIGELEKAGYPNPNFRGENLKARLENHAIHQLISFALVEQVKGCVSYILVYSGNLQTEDAVAHAYKLGSNDKVKDTALLIRSEIQSAFRSTGELPWPPTARDLQITSPNFLPSKLVNFLNIVIAGDSSDESQRNGRIVLSIGQVCLLKF